jgi:hypothetical protein
MMNHNLLKRLLCTAIAVGTLAAVAGAQMPGPGAERDMNRIKEMQRGSVLRKDSVKLTDIITVVDPETGGQEEQVVISTYSIFDYCQQLLGMNDPDVLLKGMPVQITDPNTYQPMVIQWNPTAAKVDTVK